MDRSDSFNRTYPASGFVLLLVVTIAPTLLALVCGARALPQTLADRSFLMTMAYSALLALGCSLAATLLGLPGAYLFATYRFPLKGLLKWIYALVLVLPSAVTAFFPKAIIGETGLLSMVLGNAVQIPFQWLETGILLTVLNIPAVIIIVSIWWSRLDTTIEKSASSLGIGRSSIFSHLTIPRLRKAIWGSFSFVLVRCLANLAMVMASASLSTANDQTSGTLALFTTVVSIIAILPFVSMANNADKVLGRRPRETGKPGGFQAFMVVVHILLSLLLLVLPLAAIIIKSLSFGSGNLFSNYVTLFGDLEATGFRCFVYSLLIALASALIATFIAVRLARAASPVSLVTIAFSSSVIGLGYSMVATRFPQVPNLVYAILAHVAIATPFAVFIIRPFFRAIPSDLAATSRALGYGAPYTFRRIDRRLVGDKVAVAFLISFLISLGESGTSLFLNGKTLPVLLLNTKDTALASAIASLLVLVHAILLLFVVGLFMDRGEQNV